MAGIRLPPDDSDVYQIRPPPLTVDLISDDDRSIAADSWSIKSDYGSTLDDDQRHADASEALADPHRAASDYRQLAKAADGAPLFEIIESARDIEAKQVIYAPYNILPLDSAGESQCIMQFDEIKAAVSALRNTDGLRWPTSVDPQQQGSGQLDLLDWLKGTFGFQKHNVRNQREHLILQLAHPQARLMPKPDPADKLDDRAVDGVMIKLFRNYQTWCKYMGKKHNVRLPKEKQELQQRKLLYMGLYLLIWGEAANVRFMPECLCYIFHNMAYELYGLLTENVSVVTGENIKPSYGGEL